MAKAATHSINKNNRWVIWEITVSNIQTHRNVKNVYFSPTQWFLTYLEVTNADNYLTECLGLLIVCDRAGVNTDK